METFLFLCPIVIFFYTRMIYRENKITRIGTEKQILSQDPIPDR